MVDVQGAADNDDDVVGVVVVTVGLFGGGNKFTSNDAVPALETPAPLNAVQPPSDRVGQLVLEGIESFQRFNDRLGARAPRLSSMWAT